MEELKESQLFTVLHKNVAVILIVIVTSAYFLLRRNPKVKYHLETFGGPRAIPVLGNALQLLRPHNELLQMMDDWRKTYGKTYRIWAGSFVPYAVTCDVHVIEKLISGSTYLDKGKHDYTLLDGWLGTGLLTAPGSKWSSRRKMLTPSFHFKILEDFIPVFNEQASIFLECLEKDGHGNGNVFDLIPYITNCTMDIICETAMGKKIHAQTSNVNKAYVDAVNGMCSLFLDKNMKPWLRIPLVYKLTSYAKKEEHCLRVLKNFTLEVIQAKKKERREWNENNEVGQTSTEKLDTTGIYGKQRKVFLDLLLDTAEQDHSLDDSDIREEVDTFMFEGHDTTAVNLSWTVLLLAMHPKIQKLVHSELDEIFADNPNRDVTTVDITKMKYLECCVKESLRLFPSVPLVTRQINTDLVLDDGKIIPKDATAMISMYMLHRLEEHFPDADKFIPARFLADEVNTGAKRRHPYAYLPFSAGPRNCIGQKFAMMEEKVVLAKLLRKYNIETSEKMENLVPLPDIVLRCENGVHVMLRQRTT